MPVPNLRPCKSIRPASWLPYVTLDMNAAVRGAIGLSILFIATLFAVFGDNPNFDISSTMLVIGLMLVLLAMLNHGSQRILGLTAILTFLILATALPAIVLLVAFPSSAFTPLPLNGLATVNAGLSLMFLGLFAMAMGALTQDYLFSLGTTVSRSGAAPERLPKAAAAHLMVPLLALCIVYGLSKMPFVLGISQYLVTEHSHSYGNTILQLFILLFDPDSITLLALLFVWRRAGDRKRRFMAISAIAVGYLAITLAGGSRSGLLRLFYFAVVISVALDARPRLDFKWVPAVLAGLVAVAFLSFVSGTAVRLYQNSLDDKKTDWDLSAAIHEAFPEGAMLGAANRMAAPFFYATSTTTAAVNEAARARYFGAEYTIKNVMNNVPGTPFPEAELNTSRLFGVVYRGIEESDVRKQRRYFSEIYTVWGLATLVLGSQIAAVGGLALIGFIWGAVVSLAWTHRIRQPLGYLLALFVLPGLIVWSSGIDHSVWVLVVSMVRLIFAAIVLDTISRLMDKHPIDWTDLLCAKAHR